MLATVICLPARSLLPKVLYPLDAAAAGRMQSAQLALTIAHRCVHQGKLQRVAIFLHDMNRPLEQRIGREVFGADRNMYYLGLMRGHWGSLAAWEYSKDVREAVAPK